jgi:hypothetical protein
VNCTCGGPISRWPVFRTIWTERPQLRGLAWIRFVGFGYCGDNLSEWMANVSWHPRDDGFRMQHFGRVPHPAGDIADAPGRAVLPLSIDPCLGASPNASWARLDNKIA